MRTLLDLAWMFCGLLKYGGLALALAGVVMFGWYFVRANAHAAKQDAHKQDGSENAIVWGGPRAMMGAKVIGLGLAVQLVAFVLMALLPGRP